MSEKNATIIIPTWNGKELLGKNLPLLIKSIKKEDHEIIIVDDGSTDGTAEFIRDTYPFIKLIRLKSNKGFAIACNIGVAKSKNDIVYLLNNDVVVRGNFLEPLVQHFEKKEVFAVSSKEISADLNISDSVFLPTVQFKFGIYWYRYQKINRKLTQVAPTLFVSGGHSAYDRKKFLALGGFDKLYRPFYFEDQDLCFRAWQKGWESLYEPQSVVMHHHQSTIGKYYAKKEIQYIHWKNRFLFTWKNITSKWLLIKHLFFLPMELIILPLVGKKYFTIGFFRALKQLGEISKKRRKGKQECVFSDYSILEKFGKI